jgi:hypothetical protein
MVAQTHRDTALPRLLGRASRAARCGSAGMKVDVRTETTIARPLDVVAAYAADPANAPEWYVNIDSVDWTTPPPARVGYRVAFVARFQRRRPSRADAVRRGRQSLGHTASYIVTTF